MSTKHKGWYSDPADASRFRWWTGLRWTNWLSESDTSPAPPVDLDGTLSERPELSRTRGFVATTVAGLIVLALVVGTLTVLGMRQNAINAQDSVPRLASYGPPVTRKDYRTNTQVQYSPETGEMLLREGTLALPTAPFSPAPDAGFGDGFGGALELSTEVGYTSENRIIAVVFGKVAPGYFTWGDPALAGQHLANVVVHELGFPKQPVVTSVQSGAPRMFGEREGYPSTLTATLTTKSQRPATLTVQVWLFNIEYDAWYARIDTDLDVEGPADPQEDAAVAAQEASLNDTRFFAPAPR